MSAMGPPALSSPCDERASAPELRTSARVGDAATSNLLSTLLSGPDAKSFINLTDSAGNTALHDAAWHGDKEVAEELLKAKCNPDIQNKSGDTTRLCTMRPGMVTRKWQRNC